MAKALTQPALNQRLLNYVINVAGFALCRIGLPTPEPASTPPTRTVSSTGFARGRYGRRSEGAGLGLAIVRSIAVAHKGRVDLDSTPEKGASFTIVLPGSLVDESDTEEAETDKVTQWPES